MADDEKNYIKKNSLRDKRDLLLVETMRHAI